VSQVLEKWKCNKEHLKALRKRCWDLLDQMSLYRCDPEQYRTLSESGMLDDSKGVATFQWVPRDQNECADRMAGEAYEIYCQQHGQQARYMSRPKKTKAPECKCMGCGWKGTAAELGIEDGNMRCPICETGGIQFL
jgi:hypothetical protein